MGIGVTRCGTTWFTDLLTQHPRVDLPNGVKELLKLHLEHTDLVEYCKLFTDGDLTGEFTPRYLRSFNSIERVRQVMPESAPLIVLLRDPVDRFESGMRLRGQRGKWPFPPALSDHIWSGMYADQIDVWANAFGRDRLIVFQYEAIRRNPQAAVNQVWSRLGIESVALRDTDRRSSSSTRPDTWEWPAGLREHLATLYRAQLDRLESWGVDPSLWRKTVG